MADFKWRPITPLPPVTAEGDLPAMQSLYVSWRAPKARLGKSSSCGLKDFTRRLVRQLSVETGTLERIYALDRGTTQALVTHGFVEDLVARSSTNLEPARLIDILRDQEAAIQLVMDCVARNRPLTKGILN